MMKFSTKLESKKYPFERSHVIETSFVFIVESTRFIYSDINLYLLDINEPYSQFLRI